MRRETVAIDNSSVNPIPLGLPATFALTWVHGGS